MYAPLMTSVIATVASMSQPNVLAIAAIVDAFGILGQLLINEETGQVPDQRFHISGKATNQALESNRDIK